MANENTVTLRLKNAQFNKGATLTFKKLDKLEKKADSAKKATDKTTNSVKKFSTGLKKGSKNVREFDGSFNSFAQTVTGGSIATVAALTAATAAIGAFTVQSIKAANAQELVEAKLKGVLAATKGASGISFNEMTDFAAKMQDLTGISDNLVINMQAVLSTFKEIKGPVFKDATKAIIDISKVMGTDLKSSAVQVGKALNDPATGLSRLRLSGISFTKEQEKIIKNFQKQGDIVSAQKIILAELNTQFGNTAELMGETTAGRIDALSESFGDLTESIGDSVKEATNLTNAVSGLDTIVKSLNDSVKERDEKSPFFRYLRAISTLGASELPGAIGDFLGSFAPESQIDINKKLRDAQSKRDKRLAAGIGGNVRAAIQAPALPTRLVTGAIAGSVGAARISGLAGMAAETQIEKNTRETANATKAIAAKMSTPTRSTGTEASYKVTPEQAASIRAGMPVQERLRIPTENIPATPLRSSGSRVPRRFR